MELRKLLVELAWTPFFPDFFDYSYSSLTSTSGVPAAHSCLTTSISQSVSGGLRVERNCILVRTPFKMKLTPLHISVLLLYSNCCCATASLYKDVLGQRG